MLLNIILFIVGLIVVLLFVARFTRKNYTIRRDVLVNAPAQKVFDYVKLLKNQDHFNKWVMVDPGMKREFKGTDGTVGFIYGWNGNKQAGEGELEIKALAEGKSIDTEIRFVRPFPAIAYVNMTVEPVSATQTKVTWRNDSAMNWPLNLMISTIEKMLAKDMDLSLQNLKVILEK